MNKDWANKHFGEEQVHQWRRSYSIAPPNGESLQMTAHRTLPYYQQHIMPHLQSDKNVMVCAHGNSLRAIVMHIEHLTPEQITDFQIATGSIHIYSFDDNQQMTNKKILGNIVNQ